jgi:hypothetical protein
MTRVAIKPPNEQAWLAMRALDVTSTESSALFGMSPYATRFELWHRKRDQAVLTLEPNERMDWGTDLQDQIALSLARRYGVKVERIVDYKRIESARMGSSFDFKVFGIAQASGLDVVAGDPALQNMFLKFGPGLLEIKNVDGLVFKQTWPVRDDGSIEAPAHIEIQLQHQLHVDDVEWGAIGALVGGNRGITLIRQRDREVGEAIEQRIRAFWQTIADNVEPDPKYPDDAGVIIKLFGESTDTKVFDGRGNAEIDTLLAEYKAAGDREKQAKEDKDVAKAKVLRIIDDAARVYTHNYTVSAGMVKAQSYVVTKEPYRNWRVTERKS